MIESLSRSRVLLPRRATRLLPAAILVVVLVSRNGMYFHAAPAVGVQWEATFGGPDDEVAMSICETGDRGVIVVGFRDVGIDHFDVLGLKVDADGQVVWQTSAENAIAGRLLGVMEHSSGVVIAVGTAGESGRPRLPTFFGIDQEGNIPWSKASDPSTSGELADLVETADQNVLAVGTLGAFSTDLVKLLLVKATPAGEVLWSKTAPADSGLSGRRIRQDDLGFLIAGIAYPAPSQSLAYVGVADGNGEITWERRFSYSGQFYNESSDVVRTPGGFVVAGIAITFFDGTGNTFVLSLDDSGKVQWKTALGSPQPTTCNASPSFGLAANGDYVVPGCGRLQRVTATGANAGGMDMPIRGSAARVIQSHSGDWLVAATHRVGGNGNILVARIAGERAFLRGDANRDGDVNLSDAVHLLRALFGASLRPTCADALDANDDATVDISDAIYILGFKFLGTEPLPPPSTAADHDPTPDLLGCEAARDVD